jgi:hypothetical protein
MQEVIAKIAELQDLLKQKLANADKLIADNETYRNSLKEREAKVAERENKVIPAEKVAEARESVLRDTKILEEGNRKLGQDRQDFENKKTKELADLDKCRQEVKADQQNIDLQKKEIAQDFAALNKEKAEYKERILKELEGKLGK